MMPSNTMHEDMAMPKHLWEKESKELRNAIYDDWKRKAIDSAKKRAVAQNVDYPTFANLVSVAHLQPVERKMPGQGDEEQLKHIYKGTAPAWSFNPAGTNKESDSEDGSEGGLPALLGFRKPGNDRIALEKITYDIFAKHWRHLNKDVFLQMASLTSIDPADFSEIFKVELPPNLLADILATICTCFRAEENTREDPEQQRLLRAACARDVDENWTVKMLEAMTKCGRFSLAIGFVGEKTCAMVRALLTHLLNLDWCENSDDAKDSSSRLSRIQNITALYRLPIDRKVGIIDNTGESKPTKRQNSNINTLKINNSRKER